MSRYTNTLLFCLFGICFLLGLYRLIGYTDSLIPYGYDPGFFRSAIDRAILSLPHLDFTVPPGHPYHEPLFSILVVIFSFLSFTPDQIVWPLLGVVSVFTAFAVYFFWKQVSSREVGLIAASLFLISIIQYQAFWWNYWRNLFGIFLFLISLPLFVKWKYIAILPIAALMTLHRPSAFFLLVILSVYVLIQYGLHRQIHTRWIISFFIAGIIALPLYSTQMWQLLSPLQAIVSTAWWTGTSGSFYTSKEFFLLILPYFLVSVPAIFLKTEKKEYDLILVGFIVGIIYSVWRFYFYNRMLIFLDLFCIFLAAYALVMYFGTLKRSLATTVLILFFVLQGSLYFAHAKTYNTRNTISREEFDIVKNMDIIIGTWSTVLVTHRSYTPWVLWYSQMETLAPWLLEKQVWDETKWNTFYYQSTPEQKCQMIQDYQSVAPKLFVFVWANQPSLILPEKCFRPILSNTAHPILYEVQY